MSILAYSARKSPLVRWAAGGWTFFIAENAVLSENRTYLINHLGDDNYHALYGTFSTIACVSIGYAYYKIRRTPNIPSQLILRKKTSRPPVLAAVGSFVFLGLGLGMASQAVPKLQIPVAISGNSEGTQFQVRCPFDFSDRRMEGSGDSIHGLERITRHPGLWSFGFIGLSQAFLSSTIPLRIWWM
jgi:hypothetical protein